MNIGVDIRLFAEGRQSGVEQYTENLLLAMIPLAPQHHFTFFFNVAKKTSDTRLDLFRSFPNVTIRHFRIPNKVLNSSMAFFDYPKLDTLVGGVDVWFSPNMIFSRVSRSTPSVLTVHDIAFHLLPESLSIKRKIWHDVVDLPGLIDRAKKVIAVSEATRRDLVQHYGIAEEKVVVVHSGLRPTHAITPEFADDVLKKFNITPPFFLFFATLEPRKNAAALVAAYQEYREKSKKPASLVFAGSAGWLTKKLVSEVTSSHFANECVFTGEVSEDEKIALYRRAEALIYPSLYEGFGFPPLEAMQEGTPVITAAAASLPEIVDGAAFFIDPYDIASIREALLHVEEDEDLRKRLVDRGHHFVSQYSWNTAAKKTLQILTEVV